MKREWLRSMRGSLRQLDIAQQVGISRTHYASIETGTRTPSVNVAKRIAKVFGFHWTIFLKIKYTNRVMKNLH